MKRVNITVKGIIRGFFTFLLTIVVSVLIILLSLGMSVFNDRVILQKVNESNYYNDIYNELNKKATELVTEASLPGTVLTDVITLERVYVNGKNYIEATLAGEKVAIQTTKIREDLSGNIDQYLKNEKIVVTEELKSGIETVLAETENIYRQGIQLQLMNYLQEYKNAYLRMMRVVLPIAIVLIGALCYFLIRMNQYKHRGIRQISYAVLAAATMIILSSGYLLMIKPYRKLEIAPDYYRDFLMTYFQWGSKVLLYMGFMGIIVAIILISLVNYMKNRISSN